MTTSRRWHPSLSPCRSRTGRRSRKWCERGYRRVRRVFVPRSTPRRQKEPRRASHEKEQSYAVVFTRSAATQTSKIRTSRPPVHPRPCGRDLRRAMKKEQGISGSPTDETLIYTDGRTSLYYVWEISGRLNHCLLRSRERDQ